MDESYLLLVEKRNGQSIIGEAYIEVKSQFRIFFCESLETQMDFSIVS